MMTSPFLLCTVLFFGTARLVWTQNDESASLNQFLEELPGIYEVHLRTGVVDVDAEHQRLPSPSPSARRLLQQSNAPPTSSPEWGPLAGIQLWLLSLGPELHPHPHAKQQKQQQHARIGPEQPQRAHPAGQYGALQAALLDHLHEIGCAVLSFLPPAAWMVAVSEHADLTPILEGFTDVRLAPFGPPHLRIAPELTAALAVLRRAGEAAAQRLLSGDRLDELIEEVNAEGAGWLLGALRVHTPTQGSLQGLGLEPPGDLAPRPRVQLEVSFPHLEPDDLRSLARGRLEGQRQAAGAEPSSYNPAAAAATDWSAPLAVLSPADCPPLLEPDLGSPEVLLVSVCPAALEATVPWLVAAPQVSWLAPRMASRLHNLVAGAIVQTGGDPDAVDSPNLSSSHPFWEAGLTGENQIVGCGDSGLDVRHCFFSDSSEDPLKAIKVDSSGMQYFLSSTHRKIRYLLALVQDLQDGYGHGTHVSGTLVGARGSDKSSWLQNGTGQAPMAKIAFMDLSRDRTDGVWTPGDLARSYFSRTYDVGARVHSDSWGSDLTAYDSMCAALDRFTWNNQDFLSVFAAGNYGDQSGRNTTVTTPAVAKNCIAAGASLSRSPDYAGSKWVEMYNMTATLSLAGGQGGSRTVRVVKATFGGDLATAGLDGLGLVVGLPEDGCNGLSNAGNVFGKVVLLQRGRCYFTDKVRSARAAGARAVVVYNDRLEGGYFQLQAPDSTNAADMPVGGVPLSTGRWLKAAISAGTVTVAFRKISQPSPYHYYDDIARYSSFGPTTDGRIKPDLVAPGSLRSALNGQGTSCANGQGLSYSQGTSMATPVIAGSALLVRQYFMDGYYPSGTKSDQNKFTPSGALIKAVLLGGAKHMSGVVPDTGMPLEDVPSYRQGFGRISLLHSLPLPNGGGPGWSLQVVDGSRSGAVLAQNQTHRFCVKATGGPLRITLAWYDYPAELAAARALVNDLNLQVRAAARAGLVDYGNGVEDNLNTVEQVWYDDLAAGDVAISVFANTIFAKASKQPYALVVQGKFEGTLQPPSANSSTDNTCAVQVAVIDELLSTGRLVPTRKSIYHFALQEGGTPQSGFQCRLIPYNTTTEWQPCVSPQTYQNLSDGRYTFQVRVRDEKLAASQSLTVDATPPTTEISTKLSDPGQNPTSSANASFSFVAYDDSTSITFTCRIDVQRNDPALPLRLAPGSADAGNDRSITSTPVVVGESFTCHSPLTITGMGFGDYTLYVSARDEVGNNGPHKYIFWSVRYEPNVKYARMASGIEGIINTTSLSYTVATFKGASDSGSPPEAVQPGVDDPFQSAVLNLTSGDSIADLARNAVWTNLTSQVLTVNVPSDANYLVVARPQDSINTSTWAIAEVQVDTTPPNVRITRQPPSDEVQSDPRVSISFEDAGTDGDVRVYYCRWLNSTTSIDVTALDPGYPPYEVCSRNSTVNMTEGFWLFQVKGKDLAGNVGRPSNVSFRTDLYPPVISVIDPSPVGRGVHQVVYNYTVDDGPTGTGVRDINRTCSFKSTFTANSSSEVRLSPTESPCPMPAKYPVQEGRYIWVISASDGAGLRSSENFPLIVDYTAPVSAIKSTPLRPGRKMPSRFTINFASEDKPDGSGSGVAKHICKVEQASAPPPASPPPPPPSPPLSPNSRAAAAAPSTSTGTGTSAGEGAATGSSRRTALSVAARRIAQQLQALQQQQVGMPRIYNGSAVQFGAWHVCDVVGNASNVTYDGFASGYYSFVVYAVDRAGNEGNASDPGYFFSVDASLPIDGADTVDVGDDGNSDKTKAIVVGVAVGVGVLLLIGIIIAVIYIRRRRLRKRYSPPPQLQPPPSGANGIALQPMPSSYTNGNGHSYAHNNVYHAPYNGHGALTPQPNGAPPMAASPSVVLSPTATGGVVAAVPAVPYYTVPVVAPQGADPALAAALALSAEEERRKQASATAAAEEQERIRRAIAASIEEENVRKALEASKRTAEMEAEARAAAERAAHAAAEKAAEKAALNAAIAASMATAEQEQRRLHAEVRARIQQEQQPPPSAPVGPPAESLI